MKKGQATEWRLREYLIGEKDNVLRWGMWAQVESESLDWFTGKVWVVGDVLLLSSWKCRDNAEEKNWDEVEKFLSSLPKWERTSYYLKMADIGHCGIRDCKTGGLASEEIHERIMHQLGFKKAEPVSVS